MLGRFKCGSENATLMLAQRRKNVKICLHATAALDLVGWWDVLMDDH